LGDEQHRSRRRRHLLHARRQNEHDRQLHERQDQNNGRFARMVRTSVGDDAVNHAVEAVTTRPKHIQPYTAFRSVFVRSVNADRNSDGAAVLYELISRSFRRPRDPRRSNRHTRRSETDDDQFRHGQTSSRPATCNGAASAAMSIGLQILAGSRADVPARWQVRADWQGERQLSRGPMIACRFLRRPLSRRSSRLMAFRPTPSLPPSKREPGHTGSRSAT
jgi:hypothetical protein